MRRHRAFAHVLPGKSIINSINLEDGLEKFERVTPLARAYGAALIVGCIDEDKQQAQAITRERKLAIAQRSWNLLTGDFGIPPGDIIFDPLVFPCATGDQNYVGSAVETIEGIRLIKEALPYAKTVLGISNVYLRTPEAGREVLNSVFLYHCTRAGLDLAIVNAEKLDATPLYPRTSASSPKTFFGTGATTRSQRSPRTFGAPPPAPRKRRMYVAAR